MLKRILISLLSILIILIILTGTLRYFINVCDDYLSPQEDYIDLDFVKNPDNKTVDYIFALEACEGEFSSLQPQTQDKDLCAVIGRLIKEKQYYYNIHDKEGKIVAKGTFGENTDDCIIHDIRVYAKGIYILCENNGNVLLYNIDSSNHENYNNMTISLILSVTPDIGDAAILKLLLPDNNGECFAVACNEKTILYNISGELLKTYSYSNKSVITSGVYSNGILVLCGADSSLEDNIGFSYGFAEAYDADGNVLWSEKIYDEINCISAVTECQINKNGEINLYGKFYDYNQSDVVMTTLDISRITDFEKYGHGNDYFIYTNKPVNEDDIIMQPSVFITKLDVEGNEKEVKVYDSSNDYRIPSISKEKSLNKINNNGEFYLTLAQAASLSDTSYYLTINDETVEIPNNIYVIYDVDKNGGIYTYISESGTGIYKMKYFSSIKSFSDGMYELDRAMHISETLDYIPVILPWFFISTIGIILLIAKHKWRAYDHE